MALPVNVNEQLANVLIKCTGDGLMMAGLKPQPIGISKLMQSKGTVSAIIGFVGPWSGSMIINTSESTACFLAGSLLGEKLNALDNQGLDSLSEIANMIAGGAKSALSTTEYKSDRISVPSIIVGDISSFFARGMVSVSVEFEIPEMPVKPGEIGTFTVNLSLMKI